MKLNKNNQGLEAESIAATFLQNQGLTLVQRNFHCKFGELDLIMKDGNTLVFVEVRLRSNHQFGDAAMSITPQKQRKLILTAQHFLQLHGESACRFDAILMQEAKISQVQWIRNAIYA